MEIASRVPSFAELVERSPDAQRRGGYHHTLREICQQPETWRRTAATMVQRRDSLNHWSGAASRRSSQSFLLTGSGSSLFAGECVAAALQDALRTQTRAVSGGELLTDGPQYFWAGSGSPAVISLARSGDSPESSAAIDFVLANAPACQHLIITCNQEGRLATRYAGDARVLPIVLAEETCDRGLVMTSSFTNMVVAGLFLGTLDAPQAYTRRVDVLANRATRILLHSTDEIARLARRDFRSAVFLGTGCRQGAAREAGLKLLEMTGGHVWTLVETYLGLRHGPMSAVHDTTVVICLLSSHPVSRSYELDLIRELNRKQLGLCKIVIGERIPADIIRNGDLVVDYAGQETILNADVTVLDVLVGQLLAFFRCLHMGLTPDQPSTNGAIARVVESFHIHAAGSGRA